jgi:hypothetical protein
MILTLEHTLHCKLGLLMPEIGSWRPLARNQHTINEYLPMLV